MAVNGSNYFEWTPNAAQISADESNPVLLITGNEIGTGHGFWTNVASDGSDIRVTLDDGSTEQPFHLIHIDTGAEELFLRFRATVTLSSTSPQTFRVYYNSSDTAYGPTDTFGRNNVYQDYETWLGLDEDPSGTAPQFTDFTGNGYDGTANGTMTSGDSVAGKIHNAIDWDGVDDYIEWTTAINVDGDRSITIWASTSSNSNEGILGNIDSFGEFIRLDAFNDTIKVDTDGDSETAFSTTIDQDTLYRITVTSNTSDEWKTYKNGAQVGVADTKSGAMPVNALGKSRSDDADQQSGQSDAFRIFNGELSADRDTLEYNNENDPASFSTTSAEQSAGGGAEVEAAFSLNTSPNVASSSQSVAEAGITINSQQGISDGSTATGESAITVSHSQQATTESTAQAESAMSLSSLLQAAFSKQSVTDASFTLPTVHQVTTVSDTQIINEASFSLALQKAITTQQISTIEVSYSLNTTQQAAIASDATGEAAMSMNLSAGLSLVSTALAEAGISFNAVQSVTISGQSVGLNVTLSDGRTLTITLQNRTFAIPAEKRTMTINSENRTFTIT